MPATGWVWLPSLLAVAALVAKSTSTTVLQLSSFDPDAFLQPASKAVASAAASGASDTLCLQSYSQRYISRWAGITRQLCPKSGHLPPRGSAGVACSIHPEVDLTTCFFSHLHINSSAFLGPSPRPDALPAPAPGSLQVGCHLQPASSVLRGRLLHEGIGLFFNGTLQPSTGARQACTPPPGPSALPVLMLRRDPNNPFHVLEQMVSAFAALAVAQVAGHVTNFSNIQVVVLDDHAQGPYWAILDRMSGPLKARQLRATPYPPGTCLPAAVLVPWVGDLQSLLTQHQGSAAAITCPSEVLVAASLWLRWLFRELLPQAQHQKGQQRRRLRGQPEASLPAAAAQPYGIQAVDSMQRGLAYQDQHLQQQPGTNREPGWQHLGRPLTAASAVQSPEGTWLDSSSAAAIKALHAPQRRNLQQEQQQQQEQPPQHPRRKHRRRRRQQGPRQVRLEPAAKEPPEVVPGRRLLVLWLSRAQQEAAARGRLSAWQAARVLHNEQQVVAELQEAVAAWNRRPECRRRRQQAPKDCRPRVVYELQVVELSQKPFYPDQLQLLFKAGVLVGVHGAALTNQVWLPPGGSGLVELWHGMTENYHYSNMAHMLLHAYANVQTSQMEDGSYVRDANATAVAQAVAWAMQEVAWRRSRWRQRLWSGWFGG